VEKNRERGFYPIIRVNQRSTKLFQEPKKFNNRVTVIDFHRVIDVL